MTPIGPAAQAGDNRDEELLADVFDDLLQQILEGKTPALDAILPDRPELRERIQATWDLACSVAGRREPSQPILGGYQIRRELGHGGMGTVYLACHEELQREVAIKVLPRSLALSAHAKQRFLAEARALARLRHDNVVHIHRIIDHAEMLAFEMEYVDGQSLQQVTVALKQQPRPHSLAALATVLGREEQQLAVRTSAEWFVRLGIRIARALGEVHRHGLIHRDVKPANILLRADGTPVLADFGLAREDDPARSRAGFAGTPVYAAPERLRHGDAQLDARADIYSLGVTLYEALALSPPFAGSSTQEVLRRIEGGRLPKLRKQAPHISHDLDLLLGKAMEAEPRDRYDSADAFADDLERLLNLQPILARPAGPLRRTIKFARRNQRLLSACLLSALLAAAAIWPVFAQREAQAAAGLRAARELQAARAAVLSLASLQPVSRRAFAGSSSQSLRSAAALTAQQSALTAALTHYQQLGSLPAASVDAAREAMAVAAALAITTGDRALPPGMPNLLAQVATALRKNAAATTLQSAVATAAPAERYAAGLLAFLTGDLLLSHACWQDLEIDLERQPLLEACQALQLLSDGFPERAYPRLFRAASELPGVTALQLAMAEAAMAMGDIELARRWLSQLPPCADDSIVGARRRLLAADLLAIDGDPEAAARGYRELQREDPTDPTPLLRLAVLASDRGDRSGAQRMLDLLVERWPHFAAARLEQARTSLAHRDLPGYLAVARHALAQDLDRLPRGTASQLAEVLRLGGLHRLRPPAGPYAARRAGSLQRTIALPLSGWLSASKVASVERAALLLSEFDRCLDHVRQREPRDHAALLVSIWQTSLRLPGFLLSLPGWLQAALVAAPPTLTEFGADWLIQRASPHLRTLGAPLRTVHDQPLFSYALSPDAPNFAAQLALARDIDGDTLGDVLVANPAHPNAPGAGTVEVRSLRDGELVRVLRDEHPDLMFGRSVAVLEDLDGDLCDEVLVGAPCNRFGSSKQGEVLLFSGRTGSLLWRLEGQQLAFGVALERMGDLDGDGREDFAVGIPPLSLDGSDRGKVFLGSGVDGSQLRLLVAERAGNWFGGALARVADIDGDGVSELLAGGSYGNALGFVALVSGRTGENLLTFADDEKSSDFGMAVLGLPDIDGDGTPDLAISAPALSSRGRAAGKVQLLSGRTGRVLREIHGERPGEGFGVAMALVRDWVVPNTISIAISARRGGPVGTGYVRVFDARTGLPQQTFASGPAVLQFGHSILPIGHRNDDRYPEMLVAMTTRQGVAAMLRMSFRQTRIDRHQ